MLLASLFICVPKGMASILSDEENRKTLDMSLSGHPVKHPAPRSIYESPTLELSGNTLYIIDYLPSCTLQLVDETGNIFYEAYIPEGTEQWQLPTDELEGCELRLIIDGVCYYCIL